MLQTKLKLAMDKDNFYVFDILENEEIPKQVRDRKFWIFKNTDGYMSPDYIIHIFEIAFQKFNLGQVSFI